MPNTGIPGDPTLQLTRVNRDGRYALMGTTASIDGAPNNKRGAIYEYDHQTGNIACVSCRTNGAKSQGSANLQQFPLVYPNCCTASRNITDDGGVFFASTDQLLPADETPSQDVYFYHHGTLALMTTGKGDKDNYVGENTQDGKTVFIITRSALVPEDEDAEEQDVYAVRVGGGFFNQPSAGDLCQGEACRTNPSRAPAPTAPATPSFIGADNSQSGRNQGRKKKKKKDGGKKNGKGKKNNKQEEQTRRQREDGSMRVAKLSSTLVLCLAALALLGASVASADIGIESFEAKYQEPSHSENTTFPKAAEITQAGAHADVITNIRWDQNDAENVRDIVSELPAGFYGSPLALPFCQASGLEANEGFCNPDAQVGTFYLDVSGGGPDLLLGTPGLQHEVGLHADGRPDGRRARRPGQVDRLGAHRWRLRPHRHRAQHQLGAAAALVIPRTLGSSGVRRTHSEAMQILLRMRHAVLAPAAPLPLDADALRENRDPAGRPLLAAARRLGRRDRGKRSPDRLRRLRLLAFADRAADDDGDRRAVRARRRPRNPAERRPRRPGDGRAPGLDGDPARGLSSSIRPAPTASRPAAPSRSGSSARPAREERRHFEKAEPTCPDASRIGTVRVETQLLADPMLGSVYLATPYDNPFNSLLAIYVNFKGPGLDIKLPAELKPDPQTGRLTTVFLNNPQLPFDNFKFSLFGGAFAPLRTPPACGTYDDDLQPDPRGRRRAQVPPRPRKTPTRSARSTAARATVRRRNRRFRTPRPSKAVRSRLSPGSTGRS